MEQHFFNFRFSDILKGLCHKNKPGSKGQGWSWICRNFTPTFNICSLSQIFIPYECKFLHTFCSNVVSTYVFMKFLQKMHLVTVYQLWSVYSYLWPVWVLALEKWQPSSISAIVRQPSVKYTSVNWVVIRLPIVVSKKGFERLAF